MKNLILISLLMLASCSTLPELYKDVEDIATDNAVDVSISKEALSEGKNLNINIDLNTHEEKK